jgi:hypothetical protein
MNLTLQTHHAHNYNPEHPHRDNPQYSHYGRASLLHHLLLYHCFCLFLDCLRNNDTEQGIKPVHNVQEDIILEPLLSDAIYNGYSNENHRVKLSSISYDDDSDLSIDGEIFDGGSLPSYDITPSDSHAQVDNNRKTNTRDDHLGRVKELEIVKQKTQVSDGRHNDSFSSLTDGTDTHASSDRTPKTENFEDNPEIDKGNGRVSVIVPFYKILLHMYQP